MSAKNIQKAEIETLRANSTPTFRAVSTGLEEILYQAFPVLDHGFVRVVDYMGNDAAIVQAARVSYGSGTKQVRQDKGLINYLVRHRHTTPLEMCEIKFHIKLPIFIARQWIRHRTANVNEYSARYSILAKEFYIPEKENLAAQSQINNQGRGEVLQESEANKVLELLKQDSLQTYQHYEEMLNYDEAGNIIDPKKTGLARELARMNLTLNYYTEWYWKIDLHNLLHFLYLRADNHAQYEIREYAKTMLKLVEKWVPIAYEAFIDYRQDAVELSGKMVNALKKIIKGEKLDFENSQLSKREWSEFKQIFELDL
ncbi:MAG: FAD-dependent thymidylate synthase [Rickettsiales bacterium]|jgi:thymidylate synthase (FAD)